MAKHFAIALLAPLFGVAATAQTDQFADALKKYQAGELQHARQLIDDVVRTPEHAVDPEAWLLRGFIYKDVFKDMTNESEADVVRDEAVASLYNCILLDEEKAYRENAWQAYEFLTRSYFNDAAKALNALNDERAERLFDKYKEATLRGDPKAALKAREVEFLNALGTVHTKHYNNDRTDQKRFDKAVATFKAVLAMDPENYGANYNLATLYYNQGVLRIRDISANDGIPDILEVQKVARGSFQEALPYMLKAHDMNPTRRETLLGLEGIYYSLQDQQRTDEMRRLFEELPPEKDDR